MRTPVPVRLLLLAVVCLAPAACEGSGGNSGGATPAAATASATTAAASQACADAAAVKASMADLDQLDPAQSGKAGVQAGLNKVSTNLAALKTSAKSQWSSQITGMDGALEALKATIAGINDDNLISALPAIVKDLQGIDTAWTALQQQVDKDCR